MKPLVVAIHELLLPRVLKIASLVNHTWNQQRPFSVGSAATSAIYDVKKAIPNITLIEAAAEFKKCKTFTT
jgi:hypothetical protein